MNSKKTLTIAGWPNCGAYQQAKNALLGMQAIYPQDFTVTVQEFPTRDEYMAWLPTFRDTIGAPNHKTSPIVWFEGGKYLGGRDDSVAWIRRLLSRNEDEPAVGVNVDPWNASHGYDYDLVVVGGGSGGLACAKEAVKHGAKVAVLDYVKPSPHGSKWGLGGTCVNVGCIPKKLMHFGAALHEYDSMGKNYGWKESSGKDLTLTNDWEALREGIQDHIKGLNFGYRVQLREAGITYLNKLGKFVGPNSLETTDAKGNKATITGARFVIATGGRPTPLDIPGGEYAITSDDLFSLEKSPGKTCVVGAGYIALECGGFISGLKQGEVTLLVRSTPLRTFDQDTVKYVVNYMTTVDKVKIVQGVLPKKIEKLASGKLKVTYGDAHTETSEEFDTVLCAIGRSPDLVKLGTDVLPGLQVHEKSGKIMQENEQTSLPHVYALGDIIHGAPELTPSAILAGRLLAKRLFANGTTLMNYKSIATAVFTPLELGTVGLTEDEAINLYGKDNVDALISEFKPLEWSMSDYHHEVNAFCKIIFNKQQNNKIVGMHIAAPNAGEIIQGYALAMNKGLTVEELVKHVGIHPTVGEEFTLLSVSKSSGQSIAKTGC